MQKVKRYDPVIETKSKFMMRGILLYILPLPILIALIFALLNGNFKAIIVNGISYALFLLGASVARRGFRIEKEYKESILTYAPKIKFKTLSSIIISIATFFTSFFAAGNDLFLSILLALISFIGFYLYYGLDPKIDKIGELNLGVNAEDVIDITGHAKKRIQNIKNLKSEISDLRIKKLLDDITDETSLIIKSVQENPNDLSRARKFFNVYLHRTEKITIEYVNSLKKDNIDTTINENYIGLLKSVEATIHKQKQRLNEDDITRLDVQIEALTKQIKNEGV